MIRVLVDLEDLAERTTSEYPELVDRVIERLPGLERHHCSLGRPGGLLARMRDGIRLGHLTEHLALELQARAGMPVHRGKTRAVRGQPGRYHVMYAYEDETVGLAAGRLAFEVLDRLLGTATSGLDRLAPSLVHDARDGELPGWSAFETLVRRARLGPTTASLVAEARRRRIHVTTQPELGRVVLGEGRYQTSFRASITSRTSHLAVELAKDKERTKRVLRAAGIPVPDGAVVRTHDEAIAAAAAIGAPVVLKPFDGNHGRGITRGALDPAAVHRGFDEAAQHARAVIVERELQGRDYRVLVVDGVVAAVAERRPARVTGDGHSTIAALIHELNADPRRGQGHECVLTRVHVDEPLRALLAAQGLALDSVLPAGVVVVLRDTANLSSGGDAIDRTDEIHPETAALAERAARLIGLDVAGLDIIAPDIARPLRAADGAGIIEVNAAPGFRMHLAPSEGESRDVARAVIAALHPPGKPHRIPLVSVTGTNGKSTTVRMIAHILEHAGSCVGMTTTSGVYVDGRLVRGGDSSGPKSARLVLADPRVDAAVLETARGGILREGLAYDRADVGVVLNVSADHLGLGGIDTLGQLARVKGVVARQVRSRGRTVLNADDPRTLRMARHAGGRVALFSMDGDRLPDAVAEHLAAGGAAAVHEASTDAIVLFEDGARTEVLPASRIPATAGGVAAFNVANALAALLAGRGLGVATEVIAAALATFETGFAQNPGRFNVTTAPGFTTIVDYAHNPAALRALGTAVARMRTPAGRTIGVVSTPGDRRDDDILEIGRIAAGIFDELVFRERPDGRGRAPGGVVALLEQGAREAGADPTRIRIVVDEAAAMETALRLAGPDDLVAVMPTDVDAVWHQVDTFAERSAQPADA